jgi:hypothetical protein
MAKDEKEKVYKKGTTVWLCCATHDPQSREHEEYVLEEDMTESEIQEMAKDFMWNTKEPNWWFEEEEPTGRNY